MKKIIAFLLIVVMCLSIAACGESNSDTGTTASGNSNEVELTTENILDYVHVSISYEKTGTSILGTPEIERTITIYPTVGGNFNNVQILIWDMPKDCKFQSAGSDMRLHDIDNMGQASLKRILLPADGNFTCTDKILGNTGLSKVPSSKDSVNGWDYISIASISESNENWFGSDFVKAGDPVVTGTFKAN